jgi:DNA-directed RNA polymerase specialized sigma24 family protein
MPVQGKSVSVWRGSSRDATQFFRAASGGTQGARIEDALERVLIMELSVEFNVASDQWTKEELDLFVELAMDGKGRREIAEQMGLPLSEIVHAALRYSMVLPA